MNRAAKLLHQDIDSRDLSKEERDRLHEAVRALEPKRRARRDLRIAGRTKEQRREERAGRLTEIIEAVRARSRQHGGGCEFCGWQQPSEFHHVLAGGQRRYAESVETIAWICAQCHRDWHRGLDIVYERALMWAAFHRYGKTRHAVEFRMEKAREARAASGTRSEP